MILRWGNYFQTVLSFVKSICLFFETALKTFGKVLKLKQLIFWIHFCFQTFISSAIAWKSQGRRDQRERWSPQGFHAKPSLRKNFPRILLTWSKLQRVYCKHSLLKGVLYAVDDREVGQDVPEEWQGGPPQSLVPRILMVLWLEKRNGNIQRTEYTFFLDFLCVLVIIGNAKS